MRNKRPITTPKSRRAKTFHIKSEALEDKDSDDSRMTQIKEEPAEEQEWGEVAGYNENPQTADKSPKTVKFPSLSQDEELKKQSTGLVNEQSAVDLEETINPKIDEDPGTRCICL